MDEPCVLDDGISLERDPEEEPQRRYGAIESAGSIGLHENRAILAG
jgi:hypothetical protein